jgi:uncharacterized protein (DUF2062 family)
VNLRRVLHRAFAQRARITQNPAFTWLGDHIHDPDVWHFGRRAVANGVGCGAFFALLPLPGQMLLAAAAAIVVRCNLPLAVATTWLSNPLTFAPITLIVYEVGAILTDAPDTPLGADMALSSEHLLGLLSQIGKPFLVGSLACAALAGLSANLLVRLAWRGSIWYRRRSARTSVPSA